MANLFRVSPLDMSATRMMSDPMVLTQCLDIDLEFDNPASSQPFRPITMADSQADRDSSETFCLLRKSASSVLAHPVDDTQTTMPFG